MIILNISLYNTMALHTHKSNNGEVETSQNMQQTLNTLTTHTNLHTVVSEGQSKVRWRCMKWKEENISAVIQYRGPGGETIVDSQTCRLKHLINHAYF